jgi:hypothetical protein
MFWACNRRLLMQNALTLESELRHAVIDRLIAASLRDGAPAREATLERWRAMQPAAPAAEPAKGG